MLARRSIMPAIVVVTVVVLIGFALVVAGEGHSLWSVRVFLGRDDTAQGPANNAADSGAVFSGRVAITAHATDVNKFLVSDVDNHCIREFGRHGGAGTTRVGTCGTSGAFNSLAGTSAILSVPQGILFDPVYDIFLVGSDRCIIIKVTTSYTTSLFSGVELACTPADGTTTARWSNDLRSFIMSQEGTAGNILVADRNGYAIREVQSDTTVTTIVGDFANGCTAGIGAAASIGTPMDMAYDAGGFLWIASHDSVLFRKHPTTHQVVVAVGDSGCAASGNWVDGTGNNARFKSVNFVHYDRVTDSIIGTGYDTHLYAVDRRTLRMHTLSSCDVDPTVHGRLAYQGRCSRDLSGSLGGVFPWGTIMIANSGALVEMWRGKMLAYYPMKRDGRDIIGSNDLILGSAVTFDEADKMGQKEMATKLDGTAESWIEVPAVVLNDFVDLTLCAWVKVTNTAAYQAIFALVIPTNWMAIFYRVQTNKVEMQWISRLASGAVGADPGAGAWKRHCFVKEGNNFRIYYGDVRWYTNTGGAGEYHPRVTAERIQIAHSQWTILRDHRLIGAMHDLVLYNYALTEIEIDEMTDFTGSHIGTKGIYQQY